MARLCAVCALVINTTWCVASQPYVISTFAGGAPQKTPIDAKDAWVGTPTGTATDFTDADNSRMRKISTDGIVTTFAGTGTNGFSGDGGPAGAARLQRPWGLAFDRAGNLFVADLGRVRKISPDGIISTVAGTGTPGSAGIGGPAVGAQLTTPYSVAVDGGGNLYIFDQAGYGRVVRVSTSGTLTQLAGNTDIGGPPRSRQLTYVNAVAAGASGNVFFTDSYNNRVWETSSDGSITTIAGDELSGYSGDGMFATRAQLSNPIGWRWTLGALSMWQTAQMMPPAFSSPAVSLVRNDNWQLPVDYVGRNLALFF